MKFKKRNIRRKLFTRMTILGLLGSTLIIISLPMTIYVKGCGGKEETQTLLLMMASESSKTKSPS